jgi:periplasmic protein TonB
VTADLRDGDRPWRWIACLAVAAAAHVGAAAGALHFVDHVQPPPPAEALAMIDLAPLPAPPPPEPPPPTMSQLAPPPPPPPPPEVAPDPPPELDLPVVELAFQPVVAVPKPPPKPRPKPPQPIEPVQREPEPEPMPAKPLPTPVVSAPAPPPPAAAPPPSFQSLLVAHLQRHKRYPRTAQQRRQQGVVQLRFTMDREGHVLKHALANSSGIPALDEEVLAMIERAQPLPPIPPEMPSDRLEFVVPIQFVLR